MRPPPHGKPNLRKAFMADYKRLHRSTWQSWVDMKERCDNPQHADYEHYGARCITYASEWKSFKEFLDDMGVKPPGYSLDRFNNEGDYDPCNCRWVSPKTRPRGKGTRSSKACYVHWHGRTQLLSEWCEELDLHYDRTKQRLSRNWPLERVFTCRLVDAPKASRSSS